MTKYISKIPALFVSVLLIAFGWWQEIYHYRFTFQAIGLKDPLITIAGFSLSLLLTYFAWHRKKIGFIVLIIFSIMVSIFGQNASYTAKQQEKHIDTLAYTELLEQKQRLTLEINTLNKSIGENEKLLPKNMKDRARWITNGVKPIEEKIAKYKAEKREYEEQLQTVINKLSTGEKIPTLFESIAKDLPFISALVLKYAFMSFMSLFIALMAPAGVTLWVNTFSTSEKSNGKQVKRSRDKSINILNTIPWEKDIYSIYTECRFEGQDKPAVLKSRKFVVDNSNLTNSQVNTLNKLADKLGLVSVSGNKTTPVVNKSQFEMLLRNKQSIKKMEAVK